MQQSYPVSAAGPQAGPADAGSGKTFYSAHINVIGSAPDSVVALESSPDNTTYTEQARVTGPQWGNAKTDLRARYLRANIISLGTGSQPFAAVVTAVGSGL